MDLLRDGWFSEISDMWPGEAKSIQIEKILHTEKSEYQDIMVLKTKTYGTTLILDGVIQCTERDEFAYQEMISFLPLCSHKKPEIVLIVGGGDGGVAREVSKHPDVKEIHQVEIDAKVVEVSKKYLPFMARGFDTPKLNLHIGDGFEYMKNHKNKFDVIITDSSDPVGPAANLFKENYFLLLKEALRKDGIICSQGSTVWTDLNHVKEFLGHCKKFFIKTGYALASVPTYPTGQIGFVMGSLDEACTLGEPAVTFTEEQLNSMNIKYYSDEVHRAAFVLPRFAKEKLFG